MTKAIHTFGFDLSAAAYEGTQPPIPLLAFHEFSLNGDGCLEHRIGGVLRATVPPEGAADYAAQWPACAELVAELKAADHF